MKAILPFKLLVKKVMQLAFLLIMSFSIQAQPTVTVLSEGLRFTNPQLRSGTDLRAGATYRFAAVTTNVDAFVTIDSLVNGARVNKIDDNAQGTGYVDAFQPAIQSGGVIGQSYAVFTIRFYQANTTNPVILNNVNATAVDLDGSNTLKEFVKINTGSGSLMKYLTTSVDIAMTPLANGEVYVQNVLGIERNGIDTANFSNMFTSWNSNISSMTVKYGAITLNTSQSTRQYSLYMRGFTYPSVSTLPVKLVSFTASLNSDKTDLKWASSYEKDVNYFSVEKSLDGKEYKQAGIVFAIGNSSTMNSYTFSDENINVSKSGVIYYRLRSVDIDGSFEYSAIRMITIGSQSKNALSVQAYPNPVSNELRITIPSAWQNKKVNYELIGNNGLVIRKVVIGNASQTEAINVQSLAPGFYVVAVNYNGERVQQKVIKR